MTGALLAISSRPCGSEKAAALTLFLAIPVTYFHQPMTGPNAERARMAIFVRNV